MTCIDQVLDLSGLSTDFFAEQSNRPRPTIQMGEHLIMGFPLAACVEGLRALYPEEAMAAIILENKMLVPNIFQVIVHAPAIAGAVQPGQFAIYAPKTMANVSL